MFNGFYSLVKSKDVYIFAEIIERPGRKFSIISQCTCHVSVGRMNEQDLITGFEM